MSKHTATYALIGYASGIGGRVTGAKDAPGVLRRLGLLKCIAKRGVLLRDLGDISSDCSEAEQEYFERIASPEDHLANHAPEVYAACRRLYKKTTQALQADQVPVIIGGAHSCSIGSISAISRHYREKDQKIGVIWIDTHSDIHTPTTSISKNIHGMSIAFLTGLAPGAFASLSGESPAVDIENLAYIGLRDVDAAEREIIKKHSINAFTAYSIDRYGMGNVVEQAIDVASKDTVGFVVSFDLDVCDPNIAPATGTPMRGGLTYRESHLALEMLHESEKMLGFELVEYNPNLEGESCETGELAISLVESALGARIL